MAGVRGEVSLGDVAGELTERLLVLGLGEGIRAAWTGVVTGHLPRILCVVGPREPDYRVREREPTSLGRPGEPGPDARLRVRGRLRPRSALPPVGASPGRLPGGRSRQRQHA